MKILVQNSLGFNNNVKMKVLPRKSVYDKFTLRERSQCYWKRFIAHNTNNGNDIIAASDNRRCAEKKRLC